MAQQERRPKAVQDRACRAAGSHSSDIMLGLERKRFYRCAAALLSWQARVTCFSLQFLSSFLRFVLG